jgi:transcriptional regulator with XRE-family HTH domain
MTRAHGTRARYVWGPGPGQDRSLGCRCDECCEANRAYARYQAKRKRLETLGRTSGPWAAPFVDASAARAHVLALGELGVGYKRVAELAGVSKTGLLEVRRGRRSRIRREVADAILAVPLEADVASGQLVDAAETWQLVRKILRRPGWSKARISAEIGQGGRALQLGSGQVTARNARSIAHLAEELGVAEPAGDARRFDVEPVLALGLPIAELARRTGIDGAQFHRWKRGRSIPAARADQIACSLGLHPVQLWPDWFELDEAEAS